MKRETLTGVRRPQATCTDERLTLLWAERLDPTDDTYTNKTFVYCAFSAYGMPTLFALLALCSILFQVLRGTSGRQISL